MLVDVFFIKHAGELHSSVLRSLWYEVIYSFSTSENTFSQAQASSVYLMAQHLPY
jgi:hypothetical protein